MFYDNRQTAKTLKKGAGKLGKKRCPVYAAGQEQKARLPVQAMFELASFQQPTVVSFRQQSSENYTPSETSKILIPSDNILWDASDCQEPGKYLIGLPQGFYLSDIPPLPKPAPAYFRDFLIWLTQIWELFHQMATEEEFYRRNLSNSLYNKASDRKPSSPPYPGNYAKDFLQVLKPFEDEIYLIGQESEEKLYKYADWKKIKAGEIIIYSFVFIFPKGRNPSQIPSNEFRIYMNVNPSYAPKVLQFLVEHIICNPAFDTVLNMKMASEGEIKTRKDNTFIYTSGDKDLEAVVTLITDFQKKFPHCFEDQLPPMVEPRGIGIGIAESPITEMRENRRRAPFSYGKEPAEKAKKVLEAKAAENQEFSAKVSSTIEKMKFLEKHSGNFGDRVKSLPISVIRETSVYFTHFFKKEFTEWREMMSTADFTPDHQKIEPSQYASFLDVRTKLIAEAMIDTLHLGINAFICEVWRRFEEGQINFFEPSRNLKP